MWEHCGAAAGGLYSVIIVKFALHLKADSKRHVSHPLYSMIVISPCQRLAMHMLSLTPREYIISRYIDMVF